MWGDIILYMTEHGLSAIQLKAEGGSRPYGQSRKAKVDEPN